jgi:opacity protein-like surface antigen
MKAACRTVQLVVTLSIAVCLSIAELAQAQTQTWSRAGRGEIFGLGQYMMGDSTTGLGATIEFDDIFVGGFGVGYNILDYVNVNLDMFFGATDLTGRVGAVSVGGDTTLIGFDVNVDVNILKSRLTPLVTAGLGFIRFDGDFQGFPFEETDFSYNVGAGARWDFTNHFFTKLFYRATWTKLEDTDDALLFHGITFVIGYTF